MILLKSRRDEDWVMVIQDYYEDIDEDDED